MVERNMCNAVMRGTAIPPGSKSTSRANGLRRNLGYPTSGRRLRVRSRVRRSASGRRGAVAMMHGRGKSDEAIVAVKPANKAERSAAELVERRAEAKGNARHQSMLRTLCRVQHVTRDGRMRIIVYLMMRSDPR